MFPTYHLTAHHCPTAQPVHGNHVNRSSNSREYTLARACDSNSMSTIRMLLGYQRCCHVSYVKLGLRNYSITPQSSRASHCCFGTSGLLWKPLYPNHLAPQNQPWLFLQPSPIPWMFHQLDFFGKSPLHRTSPRLVSIVEAEQQRDNTHGQRDCLVQFCETVATLRNEEWNS